jgi:hypothetical protein
MLRLSLLSILLVVAQPGHAVTGTRSAETHVMASQGPLDPAVVEEAINKLHSIGIISDPQVFIDTVKPGNFIDATLLHPVVIAAACKYETVDTVPQAIDVLAANKILSNKEKWTTDLITKPKVAAGVVQLLFLALSKNIN